MSPLDYLKMADIVFGLILAGFGGFSALIYWVHRRLKATVAESTGHIGAAQAATATRIDALERDMKQVVVELREVHSDVGRMDQRITGVERTVASLPTREDLHKLELGILGVGADVGRVMERITPIVAFSERMQDWMLEQGR